MNINNYNNNNYFAYSGNQAQQEMDDLAEAQKGYFLKINNNTTSSSTTSSSSDVNLNSTKRKNPLSNQVQERTKKVAKETINTNIHNVVNNNNSEILPDSSKNIPQFACGLIKTLKAQDNDYLSNLTEFDPDLNKNESVITTILDCMEVPKKSDAKGRKKFTNYLLFINPTEIRSEPLKHRYFDVLSQYFREVRDYNCFASYLDMIDMCVASMESPSYSGAIVYQIECIINQHPKYMDSVPFGMKRLIEARKDLYR